MSYRLATAKTSSRSTLTGSSGSSPTRKPTASVRYCTPITSMPSTTAASVAFSAGTITPRLPSLSASRAVARTPLTFRTRPSSASSPVSR